MKTTSKVKYDTYEDYLDSGLSNKDLNYIGSLKVARQLVTLGYRGNQNEEIISEEKFYKMKQEALAEISQSDLAETEPLSNNGNILNFRLALNSNTCDLYLSSMSPFVKECFKREKELKNGTLQTIVFLRVKLIQKVLSEKRFKEISGYIDLGQRFQIDDWKRYLSGEKKMMPRRGDLSFLDWSTTKLKTTSSTNFQAISDPSFGLAFKSKRDRKIVDVSLASNTRIEVVSPEYIQSIFFDHSYRKKY